MKRLLSMICLLGCQPGGSEPTPPDSDAVIEDLCDTYMKCADGTPEHMFYASHDECVSYFQESYADAAAEDDPWDCPSEQLEWYSCQSTMTCEEFISWADGGPHACEEEEDQWVDCTL